MAVVPSPAILPYRGGWELESKETITLKALGSLPQVTFPAVRGVFRKGGERAVALWWFKSGAKCAASYAAHQVNIIANQVLRRRASVAVVQVFAAVKGDDRTEGKERAADFASAAFPHIQKALP